MILSARFSPVLCVLFALALVPTLIHSYSGAVARDQRTTAAIATTLGGYRGVASRRDAQWGKRRFDSDDWIERDYSNSLANNVKLTVVRTYDPKSVYHHPELAIAYGTSFESQSTIRLPAYPDIPIHVLRPEQGEDAWAVYALLYDDRFVEDPIRFQLRTAGELLFSRRKAMTIFFALDDSVLVPGEVARLGAVGLLIDAINSFLGQDSVTQAR